VRVAGAEVGCMGKQSLPKCRPVTPEIVPHPDASGPLISVAG
jgi:hypothetical protein